MNKYLMAAMKREDTAENLSRYERQQELERQKKLNKQKKEMKKWLICKKKNKKLTIKKERWEIIWLREKNYYWIKFQLF